MVGQEYQRNKMSVEEFKSAVIRIRDILRSPGVSITGMDSMRHICLYLMGRYITIERAREMGIPEKFAWENLMDMVRNQEGGKQFALDFFYNPRSPSLVSCFDRLFGTKKFQFDITDLYKHKEILEILDKVDMERVDCEMDILGWVYEQHLKTGSSSASRDLGQYFTDRFICEYMTGLCAPGFKSPGVPESVCDPTMGTGGFLTAYVKYFKKKHAETPVNWKVQQKEIFGCDSDQRVSGVASMNLFMELGGNRAENLYTRDSLYDDLLQTGYDVILANMPFGLKGIKHADCCERVKNLKIRGTKSEPLFLQLMMVSLNRGGRCAVVVPDGMLVNNTKLHTDTRKYLVEHFEVERVIKMKGKFFMNTTIQPSVIFFKNTGNPTTEVQFWEVVKNENNEVEETMVVSVPREKLDDAYTFEMRRYMVEDTPAVNPAGFPMVKLSEVCEYKNGKTLTSKEKEEGGEYDVMGGGTKYIGKTSTYNRDGENISISKSGAAAGFVAFHNKKFWAGDCLTLKSNDETNITTKFIYQYLKHNNSIITSKVSGSTIPHCKWDDIKDLYLPLPPLEIQEEIVATLDRIYTPGTTELADTVKMTNRAMDLVLAQPDGSTLEPIVEAQRLIRKSAQMVADVKAQMVAIVKSIERRGFEMVKLKNIIYKSGSGKTNSTSITNTGEYPFYGCTAIVPSGTHISYDFQDDQYLLFAKSGGNAKNPISYNMGIGKFHLVRGPSCANVAVYQYKIINEKESIITYEYLFYVLRMNLDKFQKLAKYTTGNGNIDVNDMLNIKIPIPPLDFQESLVARLDTLQSQVDALQSLQDQSESNARFILESYLQ